MQLIFSPFIETWKDFRPFLPQIPGFVNFLAVKNKKSRTFGREMLFRRNDRERIQLLNSSTPSVFFGGNRFPRTPGFVCIFHSLNKQPLQMWDKKIRSGKIRKVRDDELGGFVMEISAPKIAATYITCPMDPSQVLGIKNSVLNITVKTLNKYFAFDIQISDDRNVKRRFRASTQQAVAEVKPFCCRLPLTLEEGWNQITFPLQEFTMRCYGTNYVETIRIQIYASCRLRRVFFSNKVCQEQELPLEFRLNQLAVPKKLTQKFSNEKETPKSEVNR